MWFENKYLLCFSLWVEFGASYRESLEKQILVQLYNFCVICNVDNLYRPLFFFLVFKESNKNNSEGKKKKKVVIEKLIDEVKSELAKQFWLSN